MTTEKKTPTILQEGRNCWHRGHAKRVALLVDAADYFDAFAQAAQQAERSILILSWDFDSRTRLWCDDRPHSEVPVVLGDFLNELVRRQRRLRVYILHWDFPVIYAFDRELPPIFGLGWRHRRHIDLRFDDNHPVGASHHQKIVVIDDKLAFVGGIDLSHDRWDTPEHLADDPRRVTEGKPYPPVHDLMMMVDGDAAGIIADCARMRWQQATGEQLETLTTAGDPWPQRIKPDLQNVEVAISRTLPAYREQPAVHEIETLYVDLIMAAKRFLYIENQYLTSARAGQALAARLQEEDGSEVVMVLRRDAGGWLEGPSTNALRARLLRYLRKIDKYRRLRVYYPVVPNLGNRHFNLHSKLLIADDELVRIGSANLNNRSLGVDSECDLTIEARGEHRIQRAIAKFRNRLLAEHLGVDPQHVSNALRREKSLIRAVQTLRGSTRTLQPLDKLDDWSDATAAALEFTDPETPISLEELTDQLAPDRKKKHFGRLLLGLLVIVLFFGGLFVAWRWTPLQQMVNTEVAREWGLKFQDDPLAPLLLIGSYIIASIVMFPRPLLTLAAVVIFGPWLGFAYAIGGIVVAALATYGAGHLLNRDTVRHLIGERLNRISKQFCRRGLFAIIAVRVVPVAPFILINLVAGAIRIRFSHFAIGTAIAMMPGTLATTVFGDQLRNLLQGKGEFNLWLVIAVVAVVAIGLFGLRWWFVKTEQVAIPDEERNHRSRSGDNLLEG